MPTSTGALRHRFTIQAAEVGAAGPDGLTTTWVPVAEAWGTLTALPEPSLLGADATPRRRVTHTITLRREGTFVLSTAHRLVLGERVFTPRTVTDPDDHGRWWRVEGEEGGQ